MSLPLLFWLQATWSIPTPARQAAQELQVFAGHAQDAWIGYRANRNGHIALYIHHIDTSGYENLGRSGLCLCSPTDTTPTHTWSGTVGERNWLFLAWSTDKNTYIAAMDPGGNTQWWFSIPGKAQRLSLLPWPSGGAILLLQNEKGLSLQAWAATGEKAWEKLLAAPETSPRKPRLLPSGMEGFLVIWEAFSGQNWQLMVQKWQWNGQAESTPTPLSQPAHSVENAEFISDGYGGLIGVYESASLTGNGKDLYLIRYTRNGTKLYEKPLCTEAGHQQNPKLYKRGTELLVVWEDNRRQDWDIFFQRIDLSTGRPLLAPEGVPLFALPGPQQKPHLILDYFQNELVALWIDFRHLQGDIYMQRHNADGKALWDFTGRPVATGTLQQHSLQTAPQDFQYFWVAYLEDIPQEGTYPVVGLITTQGAIRFQRRLQGNSATSLAQVTGLQAHPWKENLLLLWEDNRDTAGQTQIYLQLLRPDLTAAWPLQGKPLSPQSTLSQKEPQVTFRGDTVWVLWKGEESDVECDLFAQALTLQGPKVFQPKPFIVSNADRMQQEARWLPHPQKLYAYWTDNRSMEETGFDLYLRSVTPPAPEVGWRARASLQNTAFITFPPEATRAHHLWQEEINGRYQMLYAYAPLGEIPEPPLWLSSTQKPQRFPDALMAPDGTFYATFCEESPGPYEQTFLLFALSPKGERLWQQRSPFPHKHHLYPHLTLLKNGDILLTILASPAPNRWELLYARYTPKGELREKGTLLTPVPERSRWQLIEIDKVFWLLLDMPTGYTLYQGSELHGLKPVRLPGVPAEAILLPWQGRPWLFWCDKNRQKLTLSPLSPAP